MDALAWFVMGALAHSVLRPAAIAVHRWAWWVIDYRKSAKIIGDLLATALNVERGVVSVKCHTTFRKPDTMRLTVLVNGERSRHAEGVFADMVKQAGYRVVDRRTPPPTPTP